MSQRDLLIPDEKSYVEWQMKMRRIAMFETNPNCLKQLASRRPSTEKKPTKVSEETPKDKPASPAPILLINKSSNPAVLNQPTPKLEEKLEKSVNSAKKEQGPRSEVTPEIKHDRSADHALPVPADAVERAQSKKKSFYRNKTTAANKSILKQRTLKAQPSMGQSTSQIRQKPIQKQQYRINQLYKIRGSISACFEGNMGSYVENERQDLESSTRAELQKDLADPMSNSLQTEEISILNSALLMFNKMKHLINRASKISESQTMYDIYRVIKQTIRMFTQLVADDARNKEKSKGKNLVFYFNSMCIFVNTIDHIKDTLPSVNDLIVSRLENTFADQVEFGKEEDDCLDKINELVFMIKQPCTPQDPQLLNSLPSP